jgi:hypothetical protein
MVSACDEGTMIIRYMRASQDSEFIFLQTIGCVGCDEQQYNTQNAVGPPVGA